MRWLTTYDHVRGRDFTDTERRVMVGARILEEGQHPFPVPHVREWRTMYVETGRWLAHLMRDVRIAGARIVRRRFETPDAMASLPEALDFNCTGFGSRDLFGDTDMIAARGQLAILLPQPELRHAYVGRAGYMFPRPDGVVLGGTFERGVEDPTAQADDIAGILAAHRRFNQGLSCGR